MCEKKKLADYLIEQFLNGNGNKTYFSQKTQLTVEVYNESERAIIIITVLKAELLYV